MSRWVSLNQLADETGLVTRTLQLIRDKEPGVLVFRTRGKVTEYQQPTCAVNLRKREGEKALTQLREEELDEVRERARKLRADADRSELLTARLRGELAPVVTMNAAVERLASAVRNEVLGLRSRFTMSVLGLTEPAQAAAVLDDMGRQILGALASAALDTDDADDEDHEPDEVAA